jgi:hypothetical protein
MFSYRNELFLNFLTGLYDPVMYMILFFNKFFIPATLYPDDNTDCNKGHRR